MTPTRHSHTPQSAAIASNGPDPLEPTAPDEAPPLNDPTPAQPDYEPEPGPAPFPEITPDPGPTEAPPPPAAPDDGRPYAFNSLSQGFGTPAATKG
jgi:hypothetical protein